MCMYTHNFSHLSYLPHFPCFLDHSPKMLQLPSFPLLFTLLVFLFTTLVILRNKSKSKSKPKLPPGPPKLPLIGNLHQLLINSSSTIPHHLLRDLTNKHGPIMHLQLGEMSTIVISSSKLAESILRTHELNFPQRSPVLAFTVLGYGTAGLAMSPYGKEWRQRRKLCTLEVLSAKRVHSFQSVREEEVWTVIESFSSPSTRSTPINFTQLAFLLSTRITSRAAFGNECKDADEFISLLMEGTKLGGGFDLPDLFPSFKFLHSFSRMKPALERLHWKLDKILDGIIEEHRARKNMSGAREDEDIVDVLLGLQDSNDLEFPVTNTNVKALIFEIFGGGTDTSATTVEWAMSELLRNPKVMEKAQAEVRQILKRKKTINEEDTQQLKYLSLVIKETLRLHSPAPLAPRESIKTCEIGGYEIPEKAKVIINLWAINRDPMHWSDPDCFRPERFDGSPINYKGTYFDYIPFGAGRRICPGISFATASVEVTLALLLCHLDWKLPEGMKPEELDMSEVFGATVKRKYDLHVVATPV